MSRLSDYLTSTSNAIYGTTQDANTRPSPMDLMNSQIAPQQNPRGVFAILSQLARMRGQAKLASIFEAKDEEDRQLKKRDVESQIGARGANADYLKNLSSNMAADNERLDYEAQLKAALGRYNALTKSNGSEPSGNFDITDWEKLGSIPKMTQKMQNPEVEFPGYKNQPGYKQRPPTAGESRNIETQAKLQEELGKNVVVPRGAHLVNPLAGINIAGEPWTGSDNPSDHEGLVKVLKTAHPEMTDEEAQREAYKIQNPGQIFQAVTPEGKIQGYERPGASGPNKTMPTSFPEGRKTALPSEERMALAQFNGPANEVLRQIEELSNKIHTEEGAAARIRGAYRRIKSAGGYDPDVKSMLSKKGQMAVVARLMGERGVLTEPDIQRAIDLVPINPNLTHTEAQQRIKDLRALLTSAYMAKRQAAGLDGGLK